MLRSSGRRSAAADCAGHPSWPVYIDGQVIPSALETVGRKSHRLPLGSDGEGGGDTHGSRACYSDRGGGGAHSNTQSAERRQMRQHRGQITRRQSRVVTF